MHSKFVQSMLTTIVMGFAMISGAQAATFNYGGEVVESTGAFAGLIGPGTPAVGPIAYSDAAILAGLAGPGDIESIDISVGAFCFSTGDGSACPLGNDALVPVSSIDAAAITFAAGVPTGGLLDVTTFSPTFNASIPISFDFDTGTFFADGSFLGTASGTFQYVPAVVPVPAAAWLFGSALLGLAGVARRRAKA